MTSNQTSHESLSSSLLDRLGQNDDFAAWSRLTSLYGPLVYGWCRRSGLSPADAADVSQEVFAAVSGAIGRFHRNQPGGTFRGWIATITQNKVRDHFRKCATIVLAKGGSDAHQALQNVPSEGEPVCDYKESALHDKHDVLVRAAQLVRVEFEDATWQAFWRTTVNDQPPTDVANALSLSINAVYIARSRVLRRLRDELNGLL